MLKCYRNVFLMHVFHLQYQWKVYWCIWAPFLPHSECVFCACVSVTVNPICLTLVISSQIILTLFTHNHGVYATLARLNRATMWVLYVGHILPAACLCSLWLHGRAILGSTFTQSLFSTAGNPWTLLLSIHFHAQTQHQSNQQNITHCKSRRVASILQHQPRYRHIRQSKL